MYDEDLPPGFWEDDTHADSGVSANHRGADNNSLGDSSADNNSITDSAAVPDAASDDENGDDVYLSASADNAGVDAEARAKPQLASSSSDIRQSPLFGSLQSLFPGRVLEYIPIAKAQKVAEDDSEDASSTAAYDPDDDDPDDDDRD